MTKAYLKFGNKPKSYLPKLSSRRFPLVAFKSVAYKSDGKDSKEGSEDKEIQTSADLLKELNEIKSSLEQSFEAKTGKAIDEKLEAVNTSIEELKSAKPEVTAEELKKVKDDLQVTIKALDIVQARVKSSHAPIKAEAKSFNDVLEETIKANATEIREFKKGDQEKRFEMKAVGDMSVAVNFPTAGTFNVDIRNNLIEAPFNRVWLGDVLPQGTSTGSSILYPKENGGEGGAALWTDKTADKAQMDFDLTGQSAYFKWLAGIVIIEREMLDDIAFLTSYIRNKMLISLKIAENDFILNGSTDSNPVDGMLDAATTYDGTFTAAVDRIIDAGWGQLVEDTFDFYNPTHTILTPRDSVSIGLNKASGSGEYDLPAGSVAFAQGQLTVGGLSVVKTTQVGTGNFITFDKNALMFIRRMQPELRMFEDAALAKKNKIMFRVEERATLAIFNNAALVKGTLEPAES